MSLCFGALERGYGADERHCAPGRNDAVCWHDVVVPAIRQAPRGHAVAIRFVTPLLAWVSAGLWW